MNSLEPAARLSRIRDHAKTLLDIIEKLRLTDAVHIDRGSPFARQAWDVMQEPLLYLRQELFSLPRGPDLCPMAPELSGDMLRDTEIAGAISLLYGFEEAAFEWRSHNNKEHYGIWTISAAAVTKLREGVRLIGEPLEDAEPVKVSPEQAETEPEKQLNEPVPPEVDYLGVEIDANAMTISRAGFDIPISLASSPILWELFTALYEKRGKQLTKEERSRLSGDPGGHKQLANRLRDELHPIELTVNAYRLIEAVTQK